LVELVNFLEDAVPKPNSVLNGVACSLDDVLELGIVFVSEMIDQMGCFGAMETAINLDVSVEIPLKGGALNLAVFESLHDLSEHSGNRVLSSEEELSSSVRDGLVDCLACVFVEFLHVGWAVGSINSFLNILVSVLIVGHFGNLLDVVLHGLGIGSNLIHSLDIKLKVGKVLAIDIGVISLLSDDDFVDKPGSIDVCAWSPEPSCVGDIPLEILDEEEEIPNSEAMALHKDLSGLNGVDCSIERVSMELGLVLFEDWVIKVVCLFHL
jgi:hypothetical protein